MQTDNRQQLLTQTVAEFFDVDPLEMNRAFPLSGPRMQGSLPRYALDAAIRRRVGVAIGAVHKAGTFAELEDELLGRGSQNGPNTTIPANAPVSQSPVPQSPVSQPPVSQPPVSQPPVSQPPVPSKSPTRSAVPVGNVLEQGTVTACGVDIQRVDSLPQADDVWEHPFYAETFTKAEIAYCLSRERPAEHFAARWCAKEAVKKCDSAWLTADMSRIEVVLDEHGAPSLWTSAGERKERLPLALSLSHIEEMAIAMVVRTGIESVQAEPFGATTNGSGNDSIAALSGIQTESHDGSPDAARTASSANDTPSRRAKRGGRLALLLSLVGLAMAGFALWRTFP